MHAPRRSPPEAALNAHSQPLGGGRARTDRGGAARGGRPSAQDPVHAGATEKGEARARNSLSGIKTGRCGDSCRCEERAGNWGSIWGRHFIFMVFFLSFVSRALEVLYSTVCVLAGWLCVSCGLDRRGWVGGSTRCLSDLPPSVDPTVGMFGRCCTVFRCRELGAGNRNGLSFSNSNAQLVNLSLCLSARLVAR